MSIKLRTIEAEVVQAASATLLKTAMNDFLSATGTYSAESKERVFMSVTQVADLAILVLFTL